MIINAVIPARQESSRFPSKPLADICGKPMVWWVYQQAKKVDRFDNIIVATDCEEILNKCIELDMNAVLTRADHPSGTDRVTEVSEKIDGDLYVVVMGDEPLIDYNNINKMIDTMVALENPFAGMLTTKFKNGVDVVNDSTIKLALNDKNELIFMSRATIPYPKARVDYNYMKNVGVYAFTKKALNFFKNTKRGNLESIEDMEMMRFLENHKIVNVCEIESDSMSVDTPKDLKRIVNYIKEHGLDKNI